MPTAEDTRPSITLRRTIKAPVERVFAAWTDAAELSRWFCPSFLKMESVETDPRPGGRYRIAMRAPTGELHCIVGTYREYDPYSRVVFTWAWIATPERETVVTIDIAANDNGARLTLTHGPFADEAERAPHLLGWNDILAQLEAMLEGRGAAC